jgi:5-methylcytosine-specific restriction protein B
MSDLLDLNTTYQAILAAARQREFISYGDLAKANHADWQAVRYEMNTHLGKLVEIAVARGWPLLSAIVVNQSNLSTGSLGGAALDGFIVAARANDVEVGDPRAFLLAQQTAVFDWAVNAPDELGHVSEASPVKAGLAGPRFVRLFGPVLDALRALGGGGEPRDVIKAIRTHGLVSEAELDTTNKKGEPNLENKVGWARFYLAKAGLIDNERRGYWRLTSLGNHTHLDHDAALALFQDIHSRFKVSAAEDAVAPDDEPVVDLFEDPGRQFWFVGSIWDGGDQTDRFLSEGVWQNGNHDKFGAHVGRMKPGDYIAIKSSFVQKHGLPFENHGKPVSAMRIKATGRVTTASADGRTVNVDWTPLAPPIDWFFYTFRVTVVEASSEGDYSRRLILFAFGGRDQDYDFWLRETYWAKKYRTAAVTRSDLEREDEDAEVDDEAAVITPYGTTDIISDGCFLPEDMLHATLARLGAKKNLILQGPPGTGKTWLAKRLAYALLETRDRSVTRKRLRTIQFHPSLSYEDFVRGWRPEAGSDGEGRLTLSDGMFLEAVEAARAEPDRPLVVVIEEINRGNPAQIFGEMLTLLESDKRREDEGIELAYRRTDGERIHIPENLFVIGTMNIADRSLALVDLALRRRFAFVSLGTALNDRWRDWCIDGAGLDEVIVNQIQKRMIALNKTIAEDRSLGAQFAIGHSYVTPAAGEKIADAKTWFAQIVETEIQPLLEEYWFDSPGTASTEAGRLIEGL